MSQQKPVFEIDIGPSAVTSSVKVNSQDISHCLKRVVVDCGASGETPSLTKVWLEVIGAHVLTRVRGAIGNIKLSQPLADVTPLSARWAESAPIGVPVIMDDVPAIREGDQPTDAPSPEEPESGQSGVAS